MFVLNPSRFASSSGGGVWTPIIGGATSWFDPSDVSTLTLSGTDVIAWDSKIGTTTLTVNDRLSPQYGTRTVNGNSVLDFNVDQAFGGTPLGTSAKSLILTCVSVYDSSIRSQAVWLGFGKIGVNNYCGFRSVQNYSPGDLSGLILTTISDVTDYGQTDGGLHILTLMVDDVLGKSSLFIDGFLAAEDTIKQSLPTDTEYQLMGDFSSWAEHVVKGALGDVILSDDISLSHRQYLEGFLAHKWGIPAKLPIGHPFRNAPP